MSPYEQLQALDRTSNGNGTRTFRTDKEYQNWLKERADG